MTHNEHAHKETQDKQRQAQNGPLSKNTVYDRRNDETRLGTVARLSLRTKYIYVELFILPSDESWTMVRFFTKWQTKCLHSIQGSKVRAQGRPSAASSDVVYCHLQAAQRRLRMQFERECVASTGTGKQSKMKPTQQKQRQRQRRNPHPQRKTKETRRRGPTKNNNTTTENNIRIEIHRQNIHTTYVAPMTC